MGIFAVILFFASVFLILVKYVSYGLLVLIAACVCFSCSLITDELKARRLREEELWSELYADLGKIKRSLKKKDPEDE